jgi:hypothetical protein
MSDLYETRLRTVFAHLDPVPPLLEAAARDAFAWRTIDEELASLTRDSADEEAGALVRGPGGARQLSFEASTVEVELEVVATGERERRLEGQLLPPGPATVSVERPGADRVSVEADDLGRFVLEGLRAGVVRLHVLQVATPWTTI